MAATAPLKDLELIDCARANAKQGLETAAELCGYGDNLKAFQQELKQACERINIKYNELTDLITDQDSILQIGTGEIVAPETLSEL